MNDGKKNVVERSSPTTLKMEKTFKKSYKIKKSGGF